MAQSPQQLSFYWTPHYQKFACDAVVCEGHQAIATDPSHDLAHLIVAANPGMPWLPQGDRDLVCLAEYNAVLLEHLFDRACNTIMLGTSASRSILDDSLQYMSWFVNEHYAPFPISEQSAFQRFCRQIDPFLISRLFPYYLQVKQYERSHADYRTAEYRLTFTSADQPPVDELGWLAQWLIYQQVKAAQISLGATSGEVKQELRIEQLLMPTVPKGVRSPESAIAVLQQQVKMLESGLSQLSETTAQIPGLDSRIAAIEQQIQPDRCSESERSPNSKNL